MATFSTILESVIGKFHFWRESISSKSWALEKMRDVFSKELDQNPDQINPEVFATFIQSFYDNEDGCCHLVKYPGFTMSVASEMITHVILSRDDVPDKDLTLMFKLLRSAVLQGEFDKGQRVSTMFDCMGKLLVHGKSVELMMPCQFDASFALLFAIGSTQNYTRKSAEEYLIKLVQFGFNECNSGDDVLKMARTSAKDILLKLFHVFNKLLIESIGTSGMNCSPNVLANYCQILASCAECSSNWGSTLGLSGNPSECTFTVWCALLKRLSTFNFCDVGDVVVASVKQLAILANQRKDSNEGVVSCEKLSSLIVVDMLDPNSCIEISDVMEMAHSVVTGCETSRLPSDTRTLLVKLSVLPLLVVLRVPDPDCHSLDRAMKVIKEELDKGSKSKRSNTFIRHAVKNAFSLADKEDLLDTSLLTSVLNYVTFKTTDHPGNAWKPFVEGDVVLSKNAFESLISAFKTFKIVIDDPARKLTECEAEAVQTYVAAVSNFPGISHSDLSVTLECFLALLRRMKDCGSPYKDECFTSVLEALELHLVNVDPKIRDTAVKHVGWLYIMESATVQKEAPLPLRTVRVLPSVWQCVRDKEENVVAQVFQFILNAFESGNADVLNHMGITQEELMTELRTSLLSSQWDNIKPTAFSLLSSLAVSSDVIRYAEVCLQQSMSLAAPAVFGFITTKLFKRFVEADGNNVECDCIDVDDDGSEDDLENRVKGLCELLSEGWGDLLLTALNGDNTTCLRYSMDVLVRLDEFVNREDVTSIVEKMREDFDERLDASEKDSLSDRLEMLKGKAVTYSKVILRESCFLQSSSDHGDIGDQFAPSNDRVGDSGKPRKQQKRATNMEECIHDGHTISESQMGAQSNERFDHTIERRPFLLSTRSFPLPEMVSDVLSQLPLGESRLGLSNVFTFCVIKDVLGRLKLGSVKEEVYQSTDEYDRSSLTILQDINDSLDSSFRNMSKKLEKEVSDVFANELFEILERLLTAPGEDRNSQLNIKKSLAKLGHQMNMFLTSKESFFQYVLSQRRNVIFGEIDSSKLECLSDFLNGGLSVFLKELSRDIRVKSFFSSSEGMRELLNMHELSRCHSPLKTNSGKSSEDSCSTNNGENEHDLPKGTNVLDNASSNISLFASEEDLQRAVEGVKKSKQMEEDSNSSSLVATLNSSTSTKQSATVLSLELLQRIVETSKQCVVEDADEGHVPKHSSGVGLSVGAVFKALNELIEIQEEYDDGFDRDNDPTAIDCY